MNEISDKICPRCQKSFTCNANNIALCQCNGIKLTEEVKIKLEKLYSNCLCNECMNKIS